MTSAPTTVPQTVDNIAQMAALTGIAQIDAIGAAAWNTANRGQPTGDPNALQFAWIYRPVAVTTERTLRGDGPPITSVRLLGGAIGCNGA